jgi:chromosome segregation ATPase
MKNIRPRRVIQPTISTVPRYRSEANEQLELYKMVTKRQRIQQELEFTEQRLQVLKQQLNVLNKQIENSEKIIQNLRESTHDSSQSSTTLNTGSTVSEIALNKTSNKSSHFQTFYLDY